MKYIRQIDIEIGRYYCLYYRHLNNSKIIILKCMSNRNRIFRMECPLAFLEVDSDRGFEVYDNMDGTNWWTTLPDSSHDVFTLGKDEELRLIAENI